MEGNNNREYGLESYALARDDKFNYYYFSPEDCPGVALLAQQIQAQSYVSNKIMRPEALVTLENGATVLNPETTNPSGVPYVPPPGSHSEYTLAIEKGSTDLNPVTGRMVAWKKFYAPPDQPLEALPAYQFTQNNLWPGGEEYLRHVTANASLVVVEPEALGKTANAGRGAIKEFIRNEVQRVYGKGEIWFMGLVEKTVYRSWVHNWGESVVRRIGEPRHTPHPHMHTDVALMPTIIDIDNFYKNMADDILAREGGPTIDRLADFIYMADGLSDAQLGRELAAFRTWAQIRVENNE